MSFSFDRVTTGTYNFLSVILNSNSAGETIAGLFKININSISQVISGIFKLLQKLIKYFSGITTSVSFLPILFAS